MDRQKINRINELYRKSKAEGLTDAEKKEQILIGEGQDFERIRRITGYLVGTIDRWNNAKRAEERDRVKHTLSNL